MRIRSKMLVVLLTALQCTACATTSSAPRKVKPKTKSVANETARGANGKMTPPTKKPSGVAAPVSKTMTAAPAIPPPMATPAQAPQQCTSNDSASYQKIVDEARREFYQTSGEELFRQGRRYSFSFLDQNVRDALLELSTESQVPIVFDDNVNSQISIEIKKRSFLETLEMIVAAGPYDYRYNGSFFYVGVLDQRLDSWRRLSYSFRYKTRNVAPTALVKLMDKSTAAMMSPDDTLGVVAISAPRTVITSAIRGIADLDRSPRQVLLKLAITEISDKAIQRLGRTIGETTAWGAANGLSPVAPAFRQAVLSKDTFSEFLRSVDLLSKEGKAAIRAQPKIMTLDGTKATFNSKISNLVRGERYYGGKPNFIDTGVELAITPHIVDGGGVLLSIDNAKSGDFDVMDAGQINEHSISTKVQVKEGESLVLGGMISKKKRLVVSKVPWLGDIPVIGWLFRSESEDESQVEIVFTISPEVICPR